MGKFFAALVGFLAGALLVIVILFFAQGVKKGDTAYVDTWEWVDVKNLQAVPSGNNSFSYGDTCGVQQGGVVTVVGIVDNHLLVQYSIDGTMNGTSCPTGVIFFTTKKRFSEMTARFLSRKSFSEIITGGPLSVLSSEIATITERKLVEKLLSK